VIAAVIATTAFSTATAEDVTNKRACTSSQIKKVEKQIAESESVAKRSQADMYLSMAEVAKENDDTRGCLLHIQAARKVLGN
jgi:hypothetical protein